MLRDDIDTRSFDLYVVDKDTGKSNLIGKNINTAEAPNTAYMTTNDKWNMKLFLEQCKN